MYYAVENINIYRNYNSPVNVVCNTSPDNYMRSLNSVVLTMETTLSKLVQFTSSLYAQYVSFLPC
jgi:DNA-binding transcriptional regulator WhiA